MRWHEIAGGIRVPLSQEERDIMKRASEGRIARADLDEREQEVARRMVSRGVLRRIKDDGKAYFEPEGSEDLWRI